MDDRNKASYSTGLASHFYTPEGWFLDAGERLAFAFAAPELRNRPVLDLGVGVGRTTSFIRLMTDEYVAIDYSPTLVDQCRAYFPGLDISEGDARDLSRFAEGRFAGVVFSWNGIDFVDHDDRQRVLREVRRVLSEQGILVLSTLNKDGPLYMRPPWRREEVSSAMKWPKRLVRAIVHVPLNWNRNKINWQAWWSDRGLADDHGEWAIAPRGSGSDLIVHWTTVAGLRNDIGKAGFELAALFESDGEPVSFGARSARTRWLHAVARRV
jgi:SAM-dependent methyltransferase